MANRVILDTNAKITGNLDAASLNINGSVITTTGISSTVTSNSSDLITSGGVYTYVQANKFDISEMEELSGTLSVDGVDLSEIQSGLNTHTSNSTIHVTSSDKSTWNAKYSKPSSGIPKTDLVSAVQTSLGKADTAYQKPSSGIPKTDLASAVQTSLGKADTALQSHQDISGKENTSNKVTSLSNSSTDTQYPSAKAVYDNIQANKFDVSEMEELSGTLSISGVDLTSIESDISTLQSSLNTHTSDTTVHVTSSNKTTWNAKYDKPSSGIPKTDLASAVQTSLGLADTAYQKPNNGIPRSDLESSIQNGLVPFIVGTQTSSVAAWTGNAPTISALSAGLTIRYYLPQDPVKNSTLNLTLANGTKTGAKYIYFAASGTRLGTHYPKGSVITMTYLPNGSGPVARDAWYATPQYDTSDNYNSRFNTSITAKVACVAGILRAASDETGYYPLALGGTFNLNYPILWVAAAMAAADTSSSSYQKYYSVDLSITDSTMTSMTIGAPVYLVGTVSGSIFTIDSTTMCTQTVPTTADGKVYLLLGWAKSVTNIFFNNNHTLYKYINGSFSEYVPGAEFSVASMETLTGGSLSIADENLSNHISDTTIHVTAAEKTTWNAKSSITSTTVTITTGNWSNNTCTKTVSGVTASNIILVAPAPASMDNYASSGIKCTAQASNSLTFTCDTTPSESLTVNIVIFN